MRINLLERADIRRLAEQTWRTVEIVFTEECLAVSWMGCEACTPTGTKADDLAAFRYMVDG